MKKDRASTRRRLLLVSLVCGCLWLIVLGILAVCGQYPDWIHTAVTAVIWAGGLALLLLKKTVHCSPTGLILVRALFLFVFAMLFISGADSLWVSLARLPGAFAGLCAWYGLFDAQSD